MAWRIEQSESGRVLILDGFEEGVAKSPYAGIANIRNANILGVAGEASVALENQAMNIPPTVSAVAFTSDTGANTITVASTTGYYNGMAITFNSIVTTTGISTGRVYWIGDLTATSFKVYKSPSRLASSITTLATGNGSGTLSSYTLGKPLDKAIAYNADPSESWNYVFILDTNGRAWWVDNVGGTITNNLIYLGNDTLTSTNDLGRGITVFKGCLIVFRRGEIDALNIKAIENGADLDSAYNGTDGGWEYDFESADSVSESRRAAFVGQDDIMYYGGNNRIGSISENIGETFDPTSAATYTKNVSALDIPENDTVVSIGELGTWLLIGGLQNKIYPWDRISSSFNFPIIFPEFRINHIVSTNSVAYVFAGYTGKIYQTNGSSVSEFKEIPDHLTGVSTPYFDIKDVEINQGQLYFSAKISENDGTTDAVSDFDGVWAIDTNTETLRCAVASSHGTDGVVHIIVKNALTNTPAGEGLYVGWEDSSGNYGLDTGSSNPYNGGETIIEFDAIPIGTFTFPVNPTQFEFKTTDTLVSGESVQLQYRTKIKGAYSNIDTFNTAGTLSETSDTTVQNAQWLQIKAILTSTHTSPSYVPLREVRIHLS